MSLSPEALAQLEGLDLQEARKGLNFASATEVGQSVGVDLSSEELAGLRGWDLSGVMARLNGLSFVEPPSPAPMPETETGTVLSPDGGVRASIDEDQLPDWLKPAEEAAPPAETESQLPADGERSQWESLSNDEKNAAMTKAFSDWRDDGVEPPEWMKNNLSRYGFWEGDEAPRAVPLSGPTAEEAAAGLAAAEAAGPGTQAVNGGEVVIPPAREGKIREQLGGWLGKADWKNILKQGALVLGPAVFSAILWEATPQLHVAIERLVAVGILAGPLTEGAAGMAKLVDRLTGEKYQRVSRLANSIASGRSAAWLVSQVSVGAGMGIFAAEALERGFLAHAAVGGDGTGGQLGQSPDVHIPGAGGGATGEVASGNVDHLSQWPTAGVGPGAAGAGATGGGETSSFGGPSPEVREAVDAARATEAAQRAAEVAAQQAAIDALNSGKTIGELAQASGQVPWNVVRESVGSGPHAGEVTNVVTRALQAGGVDISNLHEGAISQLVTKVQGLFDSADKALGTFNLGHPYAPRPYDAGGLGAVETVKGLNSPEVQAIRAGNLADMEAARNIFDAVVKSELQPILP